MDQLQRRKQLHQILVEIGTAKVYFQPPSDHKMEYPCIVYNRDNSKTDYADNKPYQTTKRYQVTVIDRKPDSEFPDKVEKLPLSSFVRAFVADGLNHYVFNLFY